MALPLYVVQSPAAVLTPPAKHSALSPGESKIQEGRAGGREKTGTRSSPLSSTRTPFRKNGPAAA